jgi:nitrogen fixation/metabolism regulation signal transduction histidine kinase
MTLMIALYLFQSGLFISLVALILLLIIQIYEIFNFIESQQRAFIYALDSIENNDLNTYFTHEKLGTEFHDLLNKVITKLKVSRQNLEYNSQFIQHVTNLIPVAILVCDENKNVSLYNRAASNLLNLSHITSLLTIQEKHPIIHQKMCEMINDSNQLISFEFTEIKITSTEIRMPTGIQKLFTFESIGEELYARELHSWDQIIRVLSHEIMNSMTPITSLANTITDLLEPLQKKSGLNAENDFSNIISATETIARRSKTLNQFISSYRQYSAIPQLELSQVSVNELLSKIITLFSAEARKGDIDLHQSVIPESLEITADECLIEQVIINLITNSIDACKNRENALISLTAKIDKGNIIIIIEDNGIGIVTKNINDIFVPFFTTKTNGSGIGLSLCKQIIQAHNAQINLYQNEKPGTRIYIRF